MYVVSEILYMNGIKETPLERAEFALILLRI